MKTLWLLPLILFFCSIAHGDFLIGAGVGDVTGPPSDLIMMGYVRKDQKSAGVHHRLLARAFAITDEKTNQSIAIVVADLCHVLEGIRGAVLKRLARKLGGVYTTKNLLITATHTHSGPGGMSHHHFYNFRVGGFSQDNFDQIVEGISDSVLAAHANRQKGRLRLGSGDLVGANVNRSPLAYLENPMEERQRYNSDVDTLMNVLRFEGDDGQEIGMLSFFAVHATSVEGDNRLLNGDNKGLAAYLFEKLKGRDHFRNEGFVAAFANSNAGDVSPNTSGDVDGDGDWDCLENENGSCNRRSAELQFQHARDLYETAFEILEGPLAFAHRYYDFAERTVRPPFTDGEYRRTCLAAIGVSMLAGAPEDGPGPGEEGWTCATAPLWAKPLCLKDVCHGDKPVIVNMGRKHPDPWTPMVLPLQIVRLGQLALLAVPAEFTTMSGRRLRESVAKVLQPVGVRHVVLAGYANSYAGYVATREEYQVQHYEGASTHFGPWTLNAYQQAMTELAWGLRENKSVPSDPVPPLPSPKQISPGPRWDSLPSGAKFGGLIRPPREQYRRGETVRADFWGASLNRRPYPRTFVEVQKLENHQWLFHAGDWADETQIHWKEEGGGSQVSVWWEIPEDTEAGSYRVVYHGRSKNSKGATKVFQGETPAFAVSP